jgi:hypothetical protein
LPFFAGISLPDLAATATFLVSLLGLASGFAFVAALATGFATGFAFAFASGFLTAFAGAFVAGFVVFVFLADFAIGLADLAIGFFAAFAGAVAFLGATLDAGLDFRGAAFLAGTLALLVALAFFTGALEATLPLTGAAVFLARGLDLLAAEVFFTGFALFLILLLGIGLRSLT